MENQAKKRKGGAEKLRDKKTSPSLDKVLPIEKRLFTLLTKRKKTILRSHYVSNSRTSITSNTECECISRAAVVAYTGAGSGGLVWITVQGLFLLPVRPCSPATLSPPEPP